uniref:Putative ovule protein n=1 Tax=Solanum chacoense TaxID=4108 RepID=A0A0V0HIQ3_SOLCH
MYIINRHLNLYKLEQVETSVIHPMLHIQFILINICQENRHVERVYLLIQFYINLNIYHMYTPKIESPVKVKLKNTPL